MTYRLILGDAIEAMRELPAGSVDAAIFDPPYGNNTPYASYEDTPERLVELVAAFMPQVLRVAKRVLITCGVANIQIYPKADWILSWNTPAGAGSGAWGFCCWQPVLAYGKDPYLQANLGRRPDSLTMTVASEHSNHPCPKPLNVMRWLVRRGSLPGETVLDPFMGSGTTGVACRMEGRSFVGIELDSTYHAIAEQRVMQAQMPLLVTP